MADTTNKFMVSGTLGETGNVLILSPPRRSITKEEALAFAAWIVVMAHPLAGEFERILAEVEDT
jgi:hypothetical protein